MRPGAARLSGWGPRWVILNAAHPAERLAASLPLRPQTAADNLSPAD
jgi:hypothetical protein